LARLSRFLRLSCALIAGVLLAGGHAGASAARAAAQPEARVATPALWVVRDADTTIHIFGTSHMLPPGIRWLHGAVACAFARADTLVLEMVQPDNPAELRPLVMRLGLNPQGVTLSSQLPPALRDQLAEAARQVGLPGAALESMRPWLAATTLAVAGLQGLGLDPDQGVEKVLTDHARRRGLRLEGLETPEEQFGFLASLPQEDQLALLRSSIEDLRTLPAEADALMTGWMQGDVETVGALMTESLKASPRLARVLLTDRNRRWAAWIDKRMARPGHVFLAVGAGHLAGPDSLIHMLRRDGRAVERVPAHDTAAAGCTAGADAARP